MKRIIPVVYALDDNFIPFLSVSIDSVLENAGKENYYKFYVLNSGLKAENLEKLSIYNTLNSSIEFINVSNALSKVKDFICIRDNYTEAIYYRFFIPALLSEYEKIIYIDSDTVLVDDIARLLDVDLEGNILGAVCDEAVYNKKEFYDYTLNFLGVSREDYFNSGVLVFNCERFKKEMIEEKFIKMAKDVLFNVAPDQDFLNFLCKGKVKKLSLGWNKMPIPNSDFNEKDLHLIHYNLNFKPWHFDGILYEEYFWKFALKSSFRSKILQIKENYGDEEKKIAERNFKHLLDNIENCMANLDETNYEKWGKYVI